MNSSIDQDPNRTLTLILYVLYIVAILRALTCDYCFNY